jgi:ferredoxin-nitrite reductase
LTWLLESHQLTDSHPQISSNPISSNPISSNPISSNQAVEPEQRLPCSPVANTCPGLFYTTPAQDGVILRIRTPGGLLSNSQAEAIAALAATWGSDSLQITNRGNVQIRASYCAPPPQAAQALHRLQQLGLAAPNPRLDHLRNIMASPTAGIDRQELIDTRPLVQAIDAYIQSTPSLENLPAKFSIGLDGGGAVGIGTRSPLAWEHRYNEIQLSAVLDPSGSGPGNVAFRLALGADKQLWDTRVLIAPQEVVESVAALAAVYLEYQQHSGARNPRMRNLLQDWGAARYLEKVSDQLGSPLRRAKGDFIGDVFDDFSPAPTQCYAHLGVHPQRQAGRCYIGIAPALGQITLETLRGLISLAQTLGSGHLRLTPWQTLILPDVLHSQVSIALAELAALGLPVFERWDAAAIVACAGLPGCKSSATHTQAHAIALGKSLTQSALSQSNYAHSNYTHSTPSPNASLSQEQPVNIHFTGCSKSCAQPSPAEITLLGTQIAIPIGSNLPNIHSPDIHSQTHSPVEGYEVYVNAGQHRIAQVTAAEVPQLIAQLLTLYRQHRRSWHEPFDDFASWFWAGEVQP